jgi:hypothetical protein
LITGHGLIGQASTSACRSAVLLVNADPDAVKGACDLQRMRCPASQFDSGDAARQRVRTGAAIVLEMLRRLSGASHSVPGTRFHPASNNRAAWLGHPRFADTKICFANCI